MDRRGREKGAREEGWGRRCARRERGERGKGGLGDAHRAPLLPSPCGAGRGGRAAGVRRRRTRPTTKKTPEAHTPSPERRRCGRGDLLAATRAEKRRRRRRRRPSRLATPRPQTPRLPVSLPFPSLGGSSRAGQRVVPGILKELCVDGDKKKSVETAPRAGTERKRTKRTKKERPPGTGGRGLVGSDRDRGEGGGARGEEGLRKQIYIWNHSGERGRREGAKRMAGAGGEAEQGARPSMGGREDGRGWEGEGEVHLFCQRM